MSAKLEVGSRPAPLVLVPPGAWHLRAVQIQGAVALVCAGVFLCAAAAQRTWIETHGRWSLLSAEETIFAALLAGAALTIALFCLRRVRAGAKPARGELELREDLLRLPVVIKSARGRVKLVVERRGVTLPLASNEWRIGWDEIAAADWHARGIQLELRSGTLVNVELAKPPRGSFLASTFTEVGTITRSLTLATLHFNERVARLISQYARTSRQPYRSA